jgi:hypothetical protein
MWDTQGQSKENRPHRVLCAVDPDHEDQLGEEQRSSEVLVNAVQVGAQCPDQGEQDEGHQEGCQGQGHGGVGDDLQGQDLPMLWVGWLKTGGEGLTLIKFLNNRDKRHDALLDFQRLAGTRVTML